MRLFIVCLCLLLSTVCVAPPQAEGAVNLTKNILAALRGYEQDAEIYATVDSYRSRVGLLPFNFYSIPFPQPSKERRQKEKISQNLGRVLSGSREQLSNFLFTAGRNVACQPLGKSGVFRVKDVRRARHLGRHRYFGAVKLGDLSAVSIAKGRREVPVVREGFLFGSETHINNVLHFTVSYIQDGDAKRILPTNLLVKAESVRDVKECTEDSFVSEGGPVTIPDPRNYKPEKKRFTVDYYYTVQWVEASEEEVEKMFSLEWTRRARQAEGHWTTTISGILLAFLLGLGVAVVIARTVRRDLLQYADEDLADDLSEETGWKLVRGDVFRPPRLSVAFTCVISSGCQLIMMLLSVFLTAGVGVLRPSHRGNLLTGIIVCFLLTSFVAGYVGSRMLKYFKRRSWTNGFLTVVALPVSFSIGYMTLNLIHWWQHSASAIPFSTCAILLFSWVAFSIPLGIVGVTLGFRADAIAAPARVSTIPRLIPAEAARQMPYHIAIGGLVPFSACFIEVVYVLGSFWQGEPFHMLGVVAAVCCVVAVLCGEVAIIVTYLAVNHEDYRWWWRSFFSLASAGMYLFVYSIFYLFMYLELRLFSAVVLFSGYMAGISVLFGLVCGTLGFIAAALFVRGIYGAVKGD